MINECHCGLAPQSQTLKKAQNPGCCHKRYFYRKERIFCVLCGLFAHISEVVRLPVVKNKDALKSEILNRLLFNDVYFAAEIIKICRFRKIQMLNISFSVNFLYLCAR